MGMASPSLPGMRWGAKESSAPKEFSSSLYKSTGLTLFRFCCMALGWEISAHHLTLLVSGGGGDKEQLT